MKIIKDNILILFLMTVINLIVLWNFISKGETKHGIGYFVFFYIAIMIVHFFTNKFSPKFDIEVKKPKNEFLIAISFSILGFLFITLNFLLKANHIPKNIFTFIPILIGVFLFTFPVGLIIYFLIKKYKIVQLGLATKPLINLLLGVIIWGLTGLFAYFFNNEGIVWKEGIKEVGGIGGIILNGIIGAALVEEFSRFIIQSRFEKIFKISGINILVATIIWSFMHFPVNYFKGGDVSKIFVYCIQIIPLGFIWGYLTQRAKSILPSTFAHGLNLWGFQN